MIDETYNEFNNENELVLEAKDVTLFGFSLVSREKKENKERELTKSFSQPPNDDGETILLSSGFGRFGATYNTQLTSPSYVNDLARIRKYREIAEYPECDQAIEEIINEAIVVDDKEPTVKLNLDDVDLSDKIKNKILHEFDEIPRLLHFNTHGHDIFKQWYVDGRLVYHIILNEEKNGIHELRSIDPCFITKVKEVSQEIDAKTGVPVYIDKGEYFLYSETQAGAKSRISAPSISGMPISKDAIIYVTSGLLDAQRKNILSFLHKAIKPVNQLRMLEDAVVIYRLVRAPERRVFYVDVGTLPPTKAKEYLQTIISDYRNKLTYDVTTGTVKDDRQNLAMIEDFWLPRRDGKATEITTLPGGEMTGRMEDVEYFQNKLFRALNVPLNRLKQETVFSLGRSGEITREELTFFKFINRLRTKFSTLFLQILKLQLELKKIIDPYEWDEISENIKIDFLKDNQFSELKDLDIYQARFSALGMADNFVQKYYSREWIKKNILRMTEEEIDEIDCQIEKEKKKYGDNYMAGNNFIPDQGFDNQFVTNQDQSQPIEQPDEEDENIEEK